MRGLPQRALPFLFGALHRLPVRALADDDVLGLARRDVLLRPVEAALAPDVGVGDEHEPHEHRHLREAEYPETPERHGPREQEDRLDVEDDEQHRDDVELDAEPLAARQPHGVVAALVGRALDRVRTVRPQQRRRDDGADREDRREPAHHHDRQVLGQHGAILRGTLQAAFASRSARSSIRSCRSPSRPSDRFAIARRANDMIPRRGNSALVARPMIAGFPITEANQRPTMKYAPYVSSSTRGYCIVTAGRSVMSASWTSSAAISPVSIAHAMPSPLNGLTAPAASPTSKRPGTACGVRFSPIGNGPERTRPSAVSSPMPHSGGSIRANASNRCCAETSLKFANVLRSPAPGLPRPPATGNSQPYPGSNRSPSHRSSHDSIHGPGW